MKAMFGDYGIDVTNPTLCPRCSQQTLNVDSKANTWYCQLCHWRGRLDEISNPIQDADAAAPQLENWKLNGMPQGLSLGWQDLDDNLKILRGEWTVITGYASHGKSQFMDAVMVNMSHHHGWKFALFSPENVPYERHVKGLVNKFLGKRMEDEKTLIEEVRLAKKWLAKHIFFVTPPESTLEALLAQFEILVKKEKIQGIVLDPWNELEHEIPYGMNETQYVARALIKWRKFCEKFHVHGFIVTHPSKQFAAKRVDGDEGAKRPVVRLSDIAGSAHFENKAFNGISIWRDAMAEDGKKHENYIHVLKVRNSDNGQTGKVMLTWDTTSTSYYGAKDFGVQVPPAAKIKERMNQMFGNWTNSSAVKS